MSDSFSSQKGGRIIVGLGIAQIISWGSLYYSLAVISAPLRAELGFEQIEVFGAFTMGLLLSGLLAPSVGGWIDREGGRRVMAGGSLLAGLAFGLLAIANGLGLYLLAWAVAGVAMAACLYDPAFATLHSMMPNQYRRMVTLLTLMGGMASTVFWPLTNWLIAAIGWRETLALFAVLHLLVNLPIHLCLIPRGNLAVEAPAEAAEAAEPEGARPGTQEPKAEQVASVGKGEDERFYWLLAAFAASTFVTASLAAFIIEALASRGFERGLAVWIAACFGPMQVLGRLIELRFGSLLSAAKVGRAVYLLLLVAMIILSFAPPMPVFGFLFAACFGVANGTLTIVKGTAPVELFGQAQVGRMLGRIARPTFIAKAIAPSLFAGVLALGTGYSASLYTLIGIILFANLAFWRTTRVKA